MLTLNYMWDLAIILATLGGISQFYIAPGLAGAIFGGGWSWWLDNYTSHKTRWLWVGLVIALAVWITTVAEVNMGQDDSPLIILDEFAVMPLAFAGLWYLGKKITTGWLLVGALVFSLIDWTKPLFVAVVESAPGGVGVVGDDFVAALLTAVLLIGLDYLCRYSQTLLVE